MTGIAPISPAPKRHTVVSAAWAWLIASFNDISRPSWLNIPVLGFLPLTFGSVATFFYFGACIYVGLVFIGRRIGWVWPATTAFACLVTIGYFAVTIISPLAFPNRLEGWMDVGTALHYLTLTMLVGALVQAPKVDVFDLFLSGVRAACIVSFGYALVQVFVLGHPRATAGMSNAIPFGGTAMLSAGLSMIGFARLSMRMRIFAVAALLCGVGGSLLSQTRGALFALPVLAVVLGVHLWPMIRQRLLRAGLVAAAIGCLIVVFAVTVRIPDRINEVRVALESETLVRHSEQSIAHRVVLWTYGIDAFLERPLLGYGSQNAVSEVRDRAAQKGFDIPRYSHLHNEYISTAVGRGVIGLAALIALLLAPILIAAATPFDERYRDRIAFAVLLSGCYALFGLTNLLFSHDQTNTVFASAYLVLTIAAHQSRLGLASFERPFLGVPPRL